MEKPGLIFDLDGTLLDSSPDLALAVNSMLREYNLPEISHEQVTEFIGDGTPKLAERALRTAGVLESMDDPAFDEYFDTLLIHYERNLANKTRLYPGVREVLDDLKGHPMAVVTNKPSQFTRPVLEAFDLDSYFLFMAGGDRYDRKKPDPYPLLQALQSLECSPEEAVMIGDGDTDIEAGKTAGTTTVAVLYGNRSPEVLTALNPDYTIEKFTELPAIIRSLKNSLVEDTLSK